MSSIKLKGSTSGDVTITVPAEAGTNTITIPATTGTMLDTNSDLASSNLTGSINFARMPTGSVLQVQHNIVTSNYTGTSSTNVDFPAWGLTFTPQSSSSKVLCMISVGVNMVCDGIVYLKRNGTIVNDKWFGSSRQDDQYDYPQAAAFYLDSPATTSEITYQVGGRAGGCANTIRFGGSDNEASMTFMEIAG